MQPGYYGENSVDVCHASAYSYLQRLWDWETPFESLTKVIDGKEANVKSYGSTSVTTRIWAQAISVILWGIQLLLIWVSDDCSFRRSTRHSCMDYSPLLRRGRSYSLNDPNSVGIFTNAELLLTLFSNKSSPMVKRTKLFLTASFTSRHSGLQHLHHSYQPHRIHWRFNVLLDHHLTHEDSFLVELVMIFVGIRQDPHRCLITTLITNR